MSWRIYVPEAVGGVVERAHESPGRRQVGRHRGAGQREVVVVDCTGAAGVPARARRVGELDGDGLA